jgi:hypothetical protein
MLIQLLNEKSEQRGYCEYHIDGYKPLSMDYINGCLYQELHSILLMFARLNEKLFAKNIHEMWLNDNRSQKELKNIDQTIIEEFQINLFYLLRIREYPKKPQISQQVDYNHELMIYYQNPKEYITSYCKKAFHIICRSYTKITKTENTDDYIEFQYYICFVQWIIKNRWDSKKNWSKTIAWGLIGYVLQFFNNYIEKHRNTNRNELLKQLDNYNCSIFKLINILKQSIKVSVDYLRKATYCTKVATEYSEIFKILQEFFAFLDQMWHNNQFENNFINYFIDEDFNIEQQLKDIENINNTYQNNTYQRLTFQNK